MRKTRIPHDQNIFRQRFFYFTPERRASIRHDYCLYFNRSLSAFYQRIKGTVAATGEEVDWINAWKPTHSGATTPVTMPH